MAKLKVIGKEVTLTASGITGTITGVSTFATGCHHIQIQRKGVTKDGDAYEPNWVHLQDIKDWKKLPSIDMPSILGKKVQDTHTGYEGIAITLGRFEFGDDRVSIQGKELHEGRPAKPHACDMMFIKRLDATPVVKTRKPGGPRDLASARSLSSR